MKPSYLVYFLKLISSDHVSPSQTSHNIKNRAKSHYLQRGSLKQYMYTQFLHTEVCYEIRS